MLILFFVQLAGSRRLPALEPLKHCPALALIRNPIPVPPSDQLGASQAQHCDQPTSDDVLRSAFGLI
jgi:hypothetical protein